MGKRAEFEKLRSDVQIKLKFLDENRVKVMQKQLLLFHNAVAGYFSGNQTALDATMKQFAIKAKANDGSHLPGSRSERVLSHHSSHFQPVFLYFCPETCFFVAVFLCFSTQTMARTISSQN